VKENAYEKKYINVKICVKLGGYIQVMHKKIRKMKCIGRTNLFAQCKNSFNGYWPFCDKHKYQLLKFVIGSIVAIILFVISRYIYDKYINPTIEEKCPKEIEFKENKNSQFDIVILDLTNYSTNIIDAEYKFKSLFENLNEISHIPIKTKIVNCQSIDYGIANKEDAKKLCESKNIDLLFYGEFEEIRNESRFHLKYTSNPVFESVNNKESSEIDIKTESIIDLNLEEKDLRLLKDITLWNLAGIAGEAKNKDGNQIVNQYLNQISKEDETLFYYSNIISGLVYISNAENNKAFNKFDKAINYRPTWPAGYYEKSIAQLNTMEFDLAAENFKRFKIFNSECDDNNERLIYFSSYETTEKNISPQTYAEYFPCEYDTTNFNKHNEYGYCLLLQKIQNDTKLKKYFEGVFNTWKYNYPNSNYNPVVLN